MFKNLFILVVAALIATPILADEEQQQVDGKKQLPEGSELISELNSADHDFFLRHGKDGKTHLYRVKRKLVAQLSQEQQQQIQEVKQEGDTRAARSIVYPGGRPGLYYITTLPHLLLGRASSACLSLAIQHGYAASYVQGNAGAYHCYGQGTVIPTPIPEPWPYPYYRGE